MNRATEQEAVKPLSGVQVDVVTQRLLETIDQRRHRSGGRIVKRVTDGGMVAIFRDDKGRVHFKVPRAGTRMSIRLSPNRSGLLKTAENKRALSAFLVKDQLLLSFLVDCF